MENRNNSSKVIAIAALIIAIVGLSIGFAAFSNTLKISSSAEVKPDESNFDINFSSVNTEEKDGTVKATANVTDEKVGGDDATIDNTAAPTITGLHAKFTEPGQEVTYSFYAHNNGKLDGYLKSVTFANAAGATNNETKICTAVTGTRQDLVDEACKGISISVKVDTTTFTGSQAGIASHLLEVGQYEPVVVTIKYAEGSGVADGDFDVAFGDITLMYNSNDL